MTKKYYFPHDECIIGVFGSEMPVCLDEEAVNNYADELLRDYGAYELYMPAYDPYGENEDEEQEFSRETVWSWFHEADEDEIAEYGVYDSDN